MFVSEVVYINLGLYILLSRYFFKHLDLKRQVLVYFIVMMLVFLYSVVFLYTFLQTDRMFFKRFLNRKIRHVF